MFIFFGVILTVPKTRHQANVARYWQPSFLFMQIRLKRAALDRVLLLILHTRIFNLVCNQSIR